MNVAAGALAAAVALATSSSVAAHPVAPTAAAHPGATGNPTLDAANALIAEPWRGLAAQAASDAEKGIKDSFEDRAIVNWSGNASYRGRNVAKWTLKLTTKNITSNVNLAAPPGFREASLTSLKLGAPLDGSWSFRIAGLVAPSAKVKVGGVTLFSWSPGGVQFGLRIENFRTLLSTGVQAPGPLDGTNVPRFVSPSLTAQMTFGGQGFIPTLVPVQFTVQPSGSNLELLSAPIVNIPLNLGPLDARFTGRLVLAVLPTQTELSATYPEISKGELTGMGEISVSLQHIRVALRGTVRFSIPRFGSHTGSLDLGFPLVIPANDAITNARALLTRQFPLVWAESASPDPPSGSPTGAVFAAEADEIESAIVPHLLEGQVMSIDSPQNGSLVPPVGKPELSYGVEADTAIWTGHYLAGEAFRYAATSSPAALERVKLVLSGIQRQFDVTTDAVVANGRATPVNVPGPHGFFARVAWPSTSTINFPVDPNKSSAMTGPLTQRGCFYVDPEGGWQRFGEPSRTIYPDLRAAFTALTTTSAVTGRPVPPRVDIPGGQAPRNGDLVPVGKVWYGWGCGTNHPLSRDQYSGMMLGLSIANRFVPDGSVQATTKKLITQIVDYLLFNRWNVVLPPSNRIVATSSMLGNFDKQLGWLRVAASIDPGHVAAGTTLTYQQRYDAAKAAAGILWVSGLMAAVDPKYQYYKFNLTHAALAPLLVYEQDPALRATYMAGPNVLWGKLRFHRNAYFGLLRVLMHGQTQWASTAATPSSLAPGLTLGGEIRAVLGEWLRRRDLVPGLNGLPRNTLGQTSILGGQPPGATYEQNLAPSRIGFYDASDGSRSCLATYALPVWARSGYGMDFAWQKQPFEIAYDENMCNAGMAGTRPTVGQLLGWSHLNPRREGPGVDYLLPYWLGRYLNVIPPP